MSDKILLKLLKIIEDGQKQSAKERQSFIKTLKDMNDKLYFLQSHSDYLISKNADATQGLPKRKNSYDEGIPLDEAGLTEEQLGEALSNG